LAFTLVDADVGLLEAGDVADAAAGVLAVVDPGVALAADPPVHATRSMDVPSTRPASEAILGIGVLSRVGANPDARCSV
jgi:hypothetical protein